MLSLVDRQEPYSRRNCVLIHCLEDNKSGAIENAVINLISNEMDFQISPGNIDNTHKTEVPDSSKNKPVAVIFVQYNDRKQIFTSNKRFKGKDSSIVRSLRKIKIRKSNEARNTLSFSNIWTSDGNIMYRVEDDIKAKIYLE